MSGPAEGANPSGNAHRRFGERIRKVREILGLDQSAFGAALGVSQGYIVEMETGTPAPSVSMILDMMAHWPQINPDWLLTGKEPVLRPTVEVLYDKASSLFFRLNDISAILRGIDFIANDFLEDLRGGRSQDILGIICTLVDVSMDKVKEASDVADEVAHDLSGASRG
jgi:transcriptional regulator with XRE-family HTH domain